MPLLPAPPSFLPSGGGCPVTSTVDVLAAYPDRVSAEPVAPVRDAIVEMQTAVLMAYQSASAYAAAQCDPTRATGVYLAGHAAEVGVFRQDREEDEPLRDRLFAPPAVVTPVNLRAAADAVLAPYTTTRSILWESVVDRLYVGDGTTAWSAPVWDGTVDQPPDYPDRRYLPRGACSPGAAFTFSDNEGRFFVLRIPDLSEADDVAGYAYDGSTSGGLFVFDGTGLFPSFVYAGGATSDAINAAIINAIDGIRGHGIRWQLTVDAKL